MSFCCGVRVWKNYFVTHEDWSRQVWVVEKLENFLFFHVQVVLFDVTAEDLEFAAFKDVHSVPEPLQLDLMVDVA